jgi:hypothetical protein
MQIIYIKLNYLLFSRFRKILTRRRSIKIRRSFLQFSKHRNLKSKTICDFQIVPANDSSCIEFTSINFESAFFKIENRSYRSYYFRKQTCFCPGEKTFICSFVAAINKGIWISVMSMKITKYLDTIILLVCFEKFSFQKINLWMY